MLMSNAVTPAAAIATAPISSTRDRGRRALDSLMLIPSLLVASFVVEQRPTQTGALSVADALVTVHALHRVPIGARPRHQRVDHVLMTAETVRLQDLGIRRADADRLGEVLQREGARVV